MEEPFQRSLNLEGMINLSRTGKRLAVVRLSDADTERMIGRIQARFSDKVGKYRYTHNFLKSYVKYRVRFISESVNIF